MEICIIAGAWGLWAEQQWALLFANPLAFLSLGTLTACTYMVILGPLMLGVSPDEGRQLGAPARWSLITLLPFMLSILPILVLGKLRMLYPGWFPPEGSVV